MKVKMTFALLAVAALALVVPAGASANRSTIHVEQGDSIQAAIDQASPWTTIKVAPGTYAESLTIAKDGIRLIGESRKNTKIVAPAPDSECGICILDADTSSFPPVSRSTVNDVEVRNLSVQGFGFGVFAFDTRDVTVFRSIFSDYEEYGVFANNSRGARIIRNVTYNTSSTDNPEAGIYVGDSPKANATVKRNVSWGNNLGLFIRDAAHGWVLDNRAFANCAGLVFLETGAPTQPSDWLANGNQVTANNRPCPGNEDDPNPTSGVGLAVLGAADIRIIDNDVLGNVPAAGFVSPIGSGGIIITASPFVEGAPVPSTGIKVAFNTALGNSQYDITVDPSSSARTFGNDCLTSSPDGLCDDTDSGDH